MMEFINGFITDIGLSASTLKVGLGGGAVILFFILLVAAEDEKKDK